MTPLSADMTIQQRVLDHTWTLSYCLRLLNHLPADTVVVRGYSDGHTTIAQVTLAEVEAVLTGCIDQLEQDCQYWQQPALEAEKGAGGVSGGSAAV